MSVKKKMRQAPFTFSSIFSEYSMTYKNSLKMGCFVGFVKLKGLSILYECKKTAGDKIRYDIV